MRYVNNKKMEMLIGRSISKAIQFWEWIGESYGEKYGFSCPSILFYNTEFDKPYADEDVNIVRKEIDNRAITVLTACGQNNPEIPPSEQIVESVFSRTFMSYESLYNLMIECELNFRDIDDSLEFILSHEMGHIVVANQQYIGMTAGEWNTMHDECIAQVNSLPKLRKNASYKNRLKWFQSYFNIPAEKAANAAVGITNADIIKHFQRLREKEW